MSSIPIHVFDTKSVSDKKSTVTTVERKTSFGIKNTVKLRNDGCPEPNFLLIKMLIWEIKRNDLKELRISICYKHIFVIHGSGLVEFRCT